MKRILSLLFLSFSLAATANVIDTWSSPPETISTLGLDSSDPRVAMDASGNAVAVWLEGDALISKSKLVSGDWGTSTLLAASNASQPEIVVDPAGNATAIWNESGVIKTANMPFGSAWGSSTSLSASGSYSPQIAVDPSGNLVAVWVTSTVVKSATQLFGMSWSVIPDVLSATASAAPQVAISSDGTVAVCWHTLNGITSIYNVNAATKNISGIWSVASIVSNPSLNSVYANIALNSSGTACAVWYTYDLSGSAFSNVILNGAFMQPANSWSTPTAISARGIRDPILLVTNVALNDVGIAMAIWTNCYDGATFSFETSQTDANQVWATPYEIETNLFSRTVNMATNSLADVIITYVDYDTPSSSLVISETESNIGGYNPEFFTTATIISEGTMNAYPAIASVLSGGTNSYAAVVWLSNNGSNNVIQTSFGTGTAIAPPSSVAVVQNSTNYGVFTEYYNQITWDASTDPTVSGYVIYRNGVFVNSTPADQLEFMDNNQTLGEGVSYGVAAVDATGTASAVITVSYP